MPSWLNSKLQTQISDPKPKPNSSSPTGNPKTQQTPQLKEKAWPKARLSKTSPETQPIVPNSQLKTAWAKRLLLKTSPKSYHWNFRKIEFVQVWDAPMHQNWRQYCQKAWFSVSGHHKQQVFEGFGDAGAPKLTTVWSKSYVLDRKCKKP